MSIRRIACLAIALSATSAIPAAAQPGRAYAGGLVGAHVESADWAGGTAMTLGAAAGVSLTRSIGVEVEIARPSHTFTKEYEGVSVSFAAPGASRAEIERLGVLTRFTHERTVNSTVSLGMVYAPPVHPRWTPRVFAGVTNRNVEERSVFTPLRYPEGLTEEQLATVQPRDDRVTRNIGALSVGGGVAFAATRHLAVAPDVRVDYGSMGDEINNGVRTSLKVFWLF